MEEVKITKFDSMEVNILYLVEQVLMLLLEDVERRLRRNNASFNHRKKMLFNRFLQNVRHARTIDDQLISYDIYRAAKNLAKDSKEWVENIDDWRKEANQLARLLILFCDKTTENPGNAEAIFAHLESMEGKGNVSAKDLEYFHMQ